MGQSIKNRIAQGVTVVSNEFIDNYMAEANGEYVKVYFYILRMGGAVDSVSAIADALNHTEADVRRALVYWERVGVLELSDNRTGAQESFKVLSSNSQSVSLFPANEPLKAEKRSSGEPVQNLSGNEEFSQLLYIAQKYLNRTFTPTDCDVFANLYGTLHMSAELLEYLVESCAQNGHTSIRYIEKVGLSWHERGFKTAEEAKTQSMGYKKDIFAVMKAFGLSGRNPANGEIDLMDKWFGTFGFTREIVVEACNRTMAAIHKPSFQYADSILTEWSQNGVRTMKDVEELTRLRRESRKSREENSGLRGSSGSGASGGQKKEQRPQRKTANRFHNLEEHGYDYDEMVWNMISTREGSTQTGGKHGTE